MTGFTPPNWIHSPATRRNSAPILGVLRRYLPDAATVLEIACGTGEHAVYMATHLPKVTWMPSDRDPYCLELTSASVDAANLKNLKPPVALDTAAADWPVGSVDAIVCVNMVHIAPWSATEGLMRGAAGALNPAGVLYLYGPYSVGGRHTASSNEVFDQRLRHHDPDWGVRDLDDVVRLAEVHGFHLTATEEMPANNLSVVLSARG